MHFSPKYFGWTTETIKKKMQKSNELNVAIKLKFNKLLIKQKYILFVNFRMN